MWSWTSRTPLDEQPRLRVHRRDRALAVRISDTGEFIHHNQDTSLISATRTSATGASTCPRTAPVRLWRLRELRQPSAGDRHRRPAVRRRRRHHRLGDPWEQWLTLSGGAPRADPSPMGSSTSGVWRPCTRLRTVRPWDGRLHRCTGPVQRSCSDRPMPAGYVRAVFTVGEAGRGVFGARRTSRDGAVSSWCGLVWRRVSI
jgi:hypothetical protein